MKYSKIYTTSKGANDYGKESSIRINRLLI